VWGWGIFQDRFDVTRNRRKFHGGGIVAGRKIIMSATTRILTIGLLMLLPVGLLYGQGGAYGTILGTVTDNSGAVVAKAGVDVTSVATGVTKHTETTSSGDFTFPYLQPGIYRVTVQATGFQKSTVDNIGLVVGQEARADFAMKPGTINETIQVEASEVALDTDSSAVAQTVTEKQVDQLPLNGRNFLSLLFIGGGAVQTVGEQGQMRQGAGNAISINGGRPESNNYTLDGLANTDQALNTPAVILSQDAIQEFKVASENYAAEYGYSANQVNIISRSGTNQLHGTAFEFLRNDALDGTQWSRVAEKNPVLRQNQFGFVAGGPVFIPHVYDGRNKTFWLANYEGWRIRNGYTLTGVVPTPAELSGDFSATGLPAFDLTTGSDCQKALTGQNPAPYVGVSLPCMPGDPQTGAAFTSNMIDSSRFSRLATTAVGAGVFPAPSAICDPTSPNNPCNGINNYEAFPVLPNNTNQQTYKVDQTLAKYGTVFFRYTRSSFTNENPQNLSPAYSINIFNEKFTSWTASHTITLGRSNINNFRVGYLHSVAIQGAPAATSSQISALGLTGVFTNLPNYAAGFPTIGFGTILSSLGSPGNNPTTSDIPTWEFADSMTMIRGKHTIGIGFDLRRWVEKRNLSTNFLGGYSYTNNNILNNSASGSCTTPSGLCGTGNQVADFILGYYNGANTFQPGPFSSANVAGNLNQYHFLYVAPYVQDDWKVNRSLTLNLGLRWDYRAVPFEGSNKMFWIDDTAFATGGGLCFANSALANDGVAPAGNGFYRYCGRHNPADGSKTPFAPRIGFAWRPFGGDKTVVRGGYGIFWDSSLSREIDDSGDLYPYVERTQLSPNSQPTAVAPKLTDQLFPSQTAIVPVSAPNSQFVAVIISDHPRNPYVQQYTLSVQRQLARNTTLEVNYVGNRGLHLLDRVDLNTPSQLTGAQLSSCQAAFAGLPATNTTYLANQCPFFARQPYPNFAIPGPLNSSWSGYSNYNAGNVKLERRSSDLALLTVYTWAKSMDDKSAPAGIGAANAFSGHMDDRIPSLDYGPSDFSVKHRFVNSVVYQLPIGRGKKVLRNANRVADLAVGGWQISAITTFQTGFPFAVLAPDPGAYLSFNMRADQVGSPNTGFSKSINEWFNTAAFAQPAFGVYGSARRNTLTQPGINNWDIGLGKTFQISERVGFQFRVETFNTFNHTQYGIDPLAAASGGPGQSAVDNSISDATFGEVLTARPPRIIQFGGKLVF
jgi:hypothetical protein